MKLTSRPNKPTFPFSGSPLKKIMDLSDVYTTPENSIENVLTDKRNSIISRNMQPVTKDSGCQFTSQENLPHYESNVFS